MVLRFYFETLNRGAKNLNNKDVIETLKIETSED